MDAILQGMDEAARKELEASMNLFKGYKYQSDFAKKYYGEGQTEAVRADLFAVLAARHLAVSDELRARIEACADVDTLRAWVVQAVTATSTEELA